MACGRARPTACVGTSAIGNVRISSKPEASAKLKTPKTLLFLGAAVIVAHNLEEALVAPPWLSQHWAELVARLGRPVLHFSTQGLYLAITVVTLLSLVVIAVTYRSSPRSLGTYSLLTLFGIYFINAFAPHIFVALVLRSYVPGLLTALLLVVPYTVVFAASGVRSGRYTKRGVGIAVAVALLLYASIGLTVQWFLVASPSSGA